MTSDPIPVPKKAQSIPPVVRGQYNQARSVPMQSIRYYSSNSLFYTSRNLLQSFLVISFQKQPEDITATLAIVPTVPPTSAITSPASNVSTLNWNVTQLTTMMSQQFSRNSDLSSSCDLLSEHQDSHRTEDVESPHGCQVSPGGHETNEEQVIWDFTIPMKTFSLLSTTKRRSTYMMSFHTRLATHGSELPPTTRDSVSTLPRSGLVRVVLADQKSTLVTVTQISGHYLQSRRNENRRMNSIKTKSHGQRFNLHYLRRALPDLLWIWRPRHRSSHLTSPTLSSINPSEELKASIKDLMSESKTTT
jgi:hypothetical protein